MALGMEVGFRSGDFVLDGDPASPLQKRAEPPPQFSSQFYCGQTAGCIKMPLGMEVSLSPGDFVLDGTQPPPNFRTLHNHYWFAQVQVLFLEKNFNCTQYVPI